MNQENLKILKKFINAKCRPKDGSFELASGKLTRNYFDLRPALLTGHILSLVVDEVLGFANQLRDIPDAVGGPSLAANIIVPAVSMNAFERGQNIIPTVVSKTIAGNLELVTPNDQLNRILLVEDVITSGSSVKNAGEVYAANDAEILGIFAILDREAGGREILENRFDVPIHTLFKLSDF